MEPVLDASVAAHGPGEGRGIELRGAEVVAPFPLDLAAPLGLALDHADQGEAREGGLARVAAVREQPDDVVAADLDPAVPAVGRPVPVERARRRVGPRSAGRAGRARPAGRGGCPWSAGRDAAGARRRGRPRARAAPPARGRPGRPAPAARRARAGCPRVPPRGPEGRLRCAGWPRGSPRSSRPAAGHRAGAGPVRGGARRRGRPPRRPRSGTASGPGTSLARRRRSGTSRDGRLPREKSRGPLEDLVLPPEPLHLPPQPRQLGRLGLPRQGLGRAGREVLVPPAPELVGVDAELVGDRPQGLAALRQPSTASLSYSAVNRRRLLLSVLRSRCRWTPPDGCRGPHLTEVSTQPGQAQLR